MRHFKFTVDVGIVGATRVIEDEFEDDVTDEELQQHAEDLVWEYVSVNYDEVK